MRIEPALPNPEPCPVHSCSPDHETWRKNYQENKGTIVIDMAHTKRIEKKMPPKYAWDLFDTYDEFDKYETKPSFVTQMRSLAEDLVKLADEPNPDVSSDYSRVQFENESISEPEDSCDDSSNSLSLIPLDQRFSEVVHDDSIDTVPAAKNSSTDATLLDEASDQMHTRSVSPQPLTTCPNDTCNLETIVELCSLEENLGAFDDEVFSPPLTPENDPVLFNFANQPHSQDIHHDAVEVIQADYHEVDQPSLTPPDDRATHQALHEYGGQRRRLQGGLRGRRDRERRGAPDS